MVRTELVMRKINTLQDLWETSKSDGFLNTKCSKVLEMDVDLAAKQLDLKKSEFIRFCVKYVLAELAVKKVIDIRGHTLNEIKDYRPFSGS